ncbi:hypothetical protein LAZ67_13001740 [Cordylochernes scorpioides]|uniref:UBN2_3 domain-containing protein n=1 Tax=Cordylochernes scorpioides TaxID=51811 RepID=A0ABY6L6K2_9ARAC|nr:hypothetical protein LAZ67_13001740 [Cordylochernes scorpioides]
MAEYNFLSQTKIEPLTGTNYQIWALKIGAVLRRRKLFKCVISDPEPDMEDKSSWEIWSDKNDEAFGIIITTLTNEQAGMFIGETNAKKVWDSLRKTYTGNLEDKIIDIGLELKNIKMKDNETVDEYITRAKNIAARSSSLGHQFPSKELSFHIVRGIYPRLLLTPPLPVPSPDEKGGGGAVTSFKKICRFFPDISLENIKAGVLRTSNQEAPE